MWVFKALSALMLMVGCLAITLAAIWAWLSIATALIESLGWFAGAVFWVGSAAACFYWDANIKAPVLLWLRLWKYVDRIILDRNR